MLNPLVASAPDANVVVGGDYGFPLTPQGTNARDLQHFVDELGYSNLEALRAATSVGGALMRLPVGRLAHGYLADVLMVRGDVSKDVSRLQSCANLLMIMKGGHMHKRPAATREAVQIPKLDLSKVAKRCVWIDDEGNVHKRCFNPDDLSLNQSKVAKRCVWIDDEGNVHKRCFNPDDLSLDQSKVAKRCIVPDVLSLVDSRYVIIDLHPGSEYAGCPVLFHLNV